MKRIKVDGRKETLILTGMITSDRFLRDVQDILNIKLFKSSYNKRIAKWCIDYFAENNKAPMVHIQHIFEDWAGKETSDKDEVQLIAKVLDRISNEFDRADKFNIDYVLKVAEEYFSGNNLKKMAERILEIVGDDPAGASEILSNYTPIELSSTKGYDVFNDNKLIRKAFEETPKPLFKIKGDLGRMINHDLCRGSFIGIMGQEKIGKTFNLMEIANVAALNRLNVAFIQAGDMTDEQQARRLSIKTLGQSDKRKYCGNVLIPTYDCYHNQTDVCDLKQRKSKIGLWDTTTIKRKDILIKNLGNREDKETLFKEKIDEGYIPCDFCRRTNVKNYKGMIWYKKENKKQAKWRQAILEMNKRGKSMGKKKLKLISFPAGTLTIEKMRSLFTYWADKENFCVDLWCLDYADLLASDGNEYRHSQNKIWMGLRGLTQEFNCIGITPTQADAGAYGKESLDMSNYSEDKRKYSHVTTMLTLNQIYEEKIAGILRIGELVIRDDELDFKRQAYVMQNLSYGKAHIGSFF